MHHLSIAQQAFESLSPALHNALDEAVSDRAETWLRDNVCPVVEDLIRSRSFQLTTRWSVDHLAPGSCSAERRTVERVDEALVAFAGALLDGWQSRVAEVHDQLTDSQSRYSADDLKTIRLIAKRPWFDLVCTEEFFDGSRGLHLNPSSDKTESELYQTHLKAYWRMEPRVPLGDYVSRAMFARVNYWQQLLDKLATRAFSAGYLGQEKELRHFDRILVRQTSLHEKVSLLRDACNQVPSARQRDACATLTLVYVAYSPNPTLDWLGCPPSWPMASAPIIRSYIRRTGIQKLAVREPDLSLKIVEAQSASLCDPDMVRQIAIALEDVASFYEAPEDPEDLIEWTRNNARLVLVDMFPRQVHWDGRSICEGTWDNSEPQWNLLWTLANPPGRIVDQEMLRRPDRQKIASRRSRLSNLLQDCPELDMLITTRRGQGYLLDLRTEDVILLQDDGRGRLEFVDPRHPAAR
ncbi:MAG: hypothetical protein U0941_26825 [Planctomycetaceae bacterium]